MTTPEGSNAPYPAPPPGPDAYPPQAPAPQAPSPQPPPPPGYPPAGPQAYYQAAPPPKRRNRSGLIALGVLVILIVGIVGGLAFFRDQIAGGVNDLRIGDCIDEPDQTSSITDVQHQPCTDPHDGEVFYVLRDPAADGATYPGADYFREAARVACLPAASSYTGVAIDTLGVDIAWFYPTSNSWSGGDRGMTCYLYRIDGAKITGSLEAGS